MTKKRPKTENKDGKEKSVRGSSFNGFDSEEEYCSVIETAFETSLAGVCIYDQEGHFVHHNKMHEDISGYTNDMLESFTAYDLERMEKEGLSSTAMVLKDGKEVIFEQNMIPTSKQFITKGVPWRDEKGDIKYVISSIVDIEKLIEMRNMMRKETRAVSEELKIAVKDMLEENEDKFIYHSYSVKNIVEKIFQIKDSDATVLLLGESGTGKELIAKMIHEQSGRKDEKLVKINCSAIPESLMESEMFGYEAGSFTGGSAKGKKGLLEHADHGTVLLDEVGDMPLDLQAKMLRVLQEKEIQKIGRNEPIKIDIRFIAATNQDLKKMVEEGKFRRDLYYRLNVVSITVPPLRQRKEDIPILANYFVDRYNRKYRLNRKISKEAVACMVNMPFYGNIRELENLVERLVLFAKDNEITLKDIEMLGIDTIDGVKGNMADVESMGLKLAMEEYEKEILASCIKKYGSARKAAEVLKIDHSTVSKKIKKYGL